MNADLFVILVINYNYNIRQIIIIRKLIYIVYC